MNSYLYQRKFSNPAGILIQQKVPQVDEGSQAIGAQDPRGAHSASNGSSR